MATSSPHLLCNCEKEPLSEKPYDINELSTPALKEKAVRKNHVTHMPLPNKTLGPGESISFDIWVMAPRKKGATTIDVLVYYENVREAVPK